jgi:hypothetical protein
MQNLDPAIMEQMGMEKAQAEAAEIVKAINGIEGINELANANDPATIMALAEKKNADIREEELEHKKDMDFAKQVAQQRTLDLKETEILLKARDAKMSQQTNLATERMKVGSKMISDALQGLRENSKVDKSE